jgi:inner membrane transporter RhtA
LQVVGGGILVSYLFRTTLDHSDSSFPMKSAPLSPTVLVFLSIASTQLGSAIAKTLFDQLNPAAVAALRVVFAALMLVLLWRPQWRLLDRSTTPIVLGFGLSLALMNLSFYLAIDRIPIGIAVTLEFLGPLGVAVFTSRKWLDLLWVVLAAGGIVLLTPLGDAASLDWTGILLALIAGGYWAMYILLSVRVGRAVAGGAGLAIAMVMGALLLLPIGLLTGGRDLLQPVVLLIGLGVALLSSALPYSFELEALRWLPTSVFGVLLSLEPAVAAAMGFLILGETLSLRSIMAIGLVTVAAAGAAMETARSSS